jgi:hypothetical protein
MQRDADTSWFDRQFMAYIDRKRAEREARAKFSFARERVATMMLTTLAMTLGAFTLAIFGSGLVGYPIERWNEPLRVVARRSEFGRMYWYYLPSSETSLTQPGLRVDEIYILSPECVGVWLIGFLFTIPVVLRYGVTRRVAFALVLLTPTVLITFLLFTLLALGCFPTFTW